MPEPLTIDEEAELLEIYIDEFLTVLIDKYGEDWAFKDLATLLVCIGYRKSAEAVGVEWDA